MAARRRCRGEPRPRLPQRVAAAVALLCGSARAFDFSVWGSVARHSVTDDLTPETFTQLLKEQSVFAVLFYAPWCFYSQQVMPAWDLASQKLQIHSPPVKLAKIDAHRYGSIGDKYGVNAFPMIKLFVDGTIFDFDSRQGRGWQQIVKWVNHHIDRDHVLTGVEDTEHFLHDNDLNVVGLFPDGMDKDFVKSTRHFEDVLFAEARGTEVATKIADHIARHASLVCETVTIGKSQVSPRYAALPRANMECDEKPRNPQREDWTDRFSVAIAGQNLTVSRADKASGWDQELQLRCCDKEDDSAAPKYNITLPAIVMFMPHDERFAIYPGDIHDVHHLDRWVQARRTPMITRFTEETAEKLFRQGPEKTPIMFLVSNKKEDEIEKIIGEAAKELRGRANFCTSGVTQQIERRLMEVAGVEEDHLPVLTMLETHANDGEGFHSSSKYRLETKGLQAKSVVQFIDDYENHRLKPYLRSEPAPTAEENAGPVLVLVGSTFTAAARDTTKDVLVDFYAPWCGHCRKFEPLYKELARKLRHVKSLKIAKLDATRNEVEGLRIQAFPTVILFPAHGNEEIHYQGSRQPQDIQAWLHSNCKIPFDDRPPKEEVHNVTVESGLLDPSEEDL